MFNVRDGEFHDDGTMKNMSFYRISKFLLVRMRTFINHRRFPDPETISSREDINCFHKAVCKSKTHCYSKFSNLNID